MERTVFGLTFPNPVGLAAGVLTKRRGALPAWTALGFGFAEIGTAPACPARKPQASDLSHPGGAVAHHRLGFIRRLRCGGVAACNGCGSSGRWPSIPWGSLSENRKVNAVARRRTADYLLSLRAVQQFGDYSVERQLAEYRTAFSLHDRPAPTNSSATSSAVTPPASRCSSDRARPGMCGDRRRSSPCGG